MQCTLKNVESPDLNVSPLPLPVLEIFIGKRYLLDYGIFSSKSGMQITILMSALKFKAFSSLFTGALFLAIYLLLSFDKLSDHEIIVAIISNK